MRFLKPLGSCLIITSNIFVSRLINGDYEGDFKNFKILVDTEGATDELLDACEINLSDFSIIIYDNVAVVDQDYMLMPIGAYVSQNFKDDLIHLGKENTTHFVKFGKPVKVKKQKDEKKDNLEKTKDLEQAAKDKFKGTEVDIRANIKKLPNMKFPSTELFEKMESEHIFTEMDKNLFKLFFGIFTDIISVKEPMYLREVMEKDENSSSIEPFATSW